VVVCDHETSRTRRPWPALGSRAIDDDDNDDDDEDYDDDDNNNNNNNNIQYSRN
jgi:hypothetical protein